MATAFLEGRKLSVRVVSATDLPNHRIIDRMKVYCKVSLNDYAESITKSKSDKRGGVNPRWDFAVDYTVTEPAVQLAGANLVVKLYCKRSLVKDKLIGEVRISIKSLFDMGVRSKNPVSFRVDGTLDGQLHIHYNFGEKKAVLAQDASRPRPSRPGNGNTFLRYGFLLLKLPMLLLPGGQVFLSN